MNDTRQQREPLNRYEPPRIHRESRKQERPTWYPGVVFWGLMALCTLGAVAGVACLIRHKGV